MPSPDLPPVAPVSEAEVRERLVVAGYGGNRIYMVLHMDGYHRRDECLASVGLRYVSGKYYDLQEQG